MNRDQLLKKMKSINSLPTIPMVALEANRLLQDLDSPLEQLVQLLEKDQSLVVKILRLVNSSFYGFKSKIKTLRHAVTLLGFNTVRNAVVTITVIDSLGVKTKLDEFKIDDFWRHSIHVAVLSKFLAVRTRLAPCEDAFTAGLLHDVGKVVLAGFFAEELLAILETARADQLTFYDAEQKLSYCPHHLIGAFLAQRWLLPEALVQTIQYHHSETDRASQNPIICIVSTANRIVHMMRAEKGYTLQTDKDKEGENSIRTTIMEWLKNDSGWFVEIKKEMDAACKFFNKG